MIAILQCVMHYSYAQGVSQSASTTQSSINLLSSPFKKSFPVASSTPLPVITQRKSVRKTQVKRPVRTSPVKSPVRTTPVKISFQVKTPSSDKLPASSSPKTKGNVIIFHQTQITAPSTVAVSAHKRYGLRQRNALSSPKKKGEELPFIVVVCLGKRIARSKNICQGCGGYYQSSQSEKWVGCDYCWRWWHISCLKLPKGANLDDLKCNICRKI